VPVPCKGRSDVVEGEDAYTELVLDGALVLAEDWEVEELECLVDLHMFGSLIKISLSLA
jgi:hypothetical protein